MSKSSQGNKGEEKVKKVLNSIKEKHIVFNDISFKNEHSEMTHQIDHIIIKSNGVFVIETKNYFGKILVQNDGKNWTKIIGNKIEKISSPVMQNKSHAVTVFKAIKGYVKTVPVVVLVQNNSPYIESENVINLKDLKLFLDTYENDIELDDNQINEIAKMIKDSSIKITRDEHISISSIINKLFKKEKKRCLLQ